MNGFPEKVLLATDGLENTTLAARLAGSLGAKLFALYVVDEHLTFHAGVHYGEFIEMLTQDGREATGKVRALAEKVGVEASDILFAIDSVPAVLSVTQTAFVAYSSIVFAVLGLRALYFALEGLIDRFVYLHYGLAVILVFVGAKFVAQGFGLQIPIVTSLLVILVAIVASIAVSLGATRGGNPQSER